MIRDEFWNTSKFEDIKQFYGKRERMMQEPLSAGFFNSLLVVNDGIARNTSIVNNKEMIHFSSFDYLGYSGSEVVAKAAKDAIDKFGTSVSASRLVSGEKSIHRDLEHELATLYKQDAAMVFSSGHHCNETVIGHLFGRNDLIIHDELAHDCIVSGAVLSGARRRSYKHSSLQNLENILQSERLKYEKCGVICEGVYSMDGDISPMPGFVALKKKYKFLLYVDESHATGTVGPDGGGTRSHFDLAPDDVDVWMGTLSKSLASCGGFITANATLVNYLKYTCPGFIFSTGISPANTAAALAAVQLMKREPHNVRQLQQNADAFREMLQSAGLDTGLSNGTAIVPLMLGSTELAMGLAQKMADRGINVHAIVYPAVKESEARLRFFISSTHTMRNLRYTADALVEAMVLNKTYVDVAAKRVDEVCTLAVPKVSLNQTDAAEEVTRKSKKATIMTAKDEVTDEVKEA